MKQIRDSGYWILLFVLIGASLYFTASVYRTKNMAVMSAAGLTYKSGQKALVKKIGDGDQIIVETGHGRFVVRLLGISSFDPSLNDPLVRGAGEAAYFHLQKTVLNRDVELIFEEWKVDAAGRALVYVHLNGADIGGEMVASGMSLAYTKYPFSRMNQYLRAQRSAHEAKKGIWENPVLAERAVQLARSWEGGRE